MTYVLRFLPEVEKDVLNGRAWYEDKSPGLARNSCVSFTSVPRN